MKKSFILLCGLMGMLTFSCKDDEEKDNNTLSQDYNAEYTAVIDNYVDNVVISTYSKQKENAEKQLNAVLKFSESGSQNDLDKACDAWREESEAFLFGPAATYSLDPSLDSWPLDKVQIEKYLSSSIDFDMDGLGSTVRGFHTLEYLLFEDGKARKASTISDRQKEYMVAVASGIRNDSFKLWYYWNGNNNLSSDDEELIEELEPDAQTSQVKLANKKSEVRLKTKTWRMLNHGTHGTHWMIIRIIS